MDDIKLLMMFNDIEPDILAALGRGLEANNVPVDILAEAGKGALDKAATAETDGKVGKRMGWKSYLAIAAAAAFLIMMITVSVKAYLPIPSGSNQAQNNQSQDESGGNGAKDLLKLSAIAAPEYPAKKEFYWEDNFKTQDLDQNFVSALQNFSSQASSVVLSTGETGKNQVFSPLSLYMAIAMTANGASGETRNEILNTLSMSNFDMETINRQTKQLFQNLYFDNGSGHLMLNNSLWLDKSVPFKKELLQNLAQDYYAYSFSADFKDTQQTAGQINEWIAENTDGKLGKDKETQLKIDPHDIMSILNTVNFYDEWDWVFDDGTAQDQFHLADGTTLKSDFMSETIPANYINGDHYMAAEYPFKSRGKMIFVLPDQGVSPDSLMENPQFVNGVVNNLNTKGKSAEVTYKVPKFSYENHFNLNDILESMGMKRAFLPDLAEFSNIADLRKPLFIGSVEQADYISIDEKGCEATSYTAALPMTGGGENIVPEKVNLTLDRPFIFIVTFDGGFYNDMPLFVGIVNDPTK